MWISRPGNKEETFGNRHKVFKWTRYYLIFFVISLVLPIVVSITNHGKSDGIKILLDVVDEQYMTKVKLAPEKFEEFRVCSLVAISFLQYKNWLVLCLHFSLLLSNKSKFFYFSSRYVPEGKNFFVFRVLILICLVSKNDSALL